ncbi:MAG: hypothetical protein LC770_14370 [Acidobacteria bacterium]|nr:hypothetical protein [Acidobacteriota bacterium]
MLSTLRFRVESAQGHREMHRPVAEELLIQQKVVEQIRSKISMNLEVGASILG